MINNRHVKSPLIDINCPSTIGWPLNNHWVVGRGVPWARHLNTTVLPSVAFLLEGNVSIVAGSENINRSHEYFAHHHILQGNLSDNQLWRLQSARCGDKDDIYYTLHITVNRNSEFMAHHYTLTSSCTTFLHYRDVLCHNLIIFICQ